MFDNSSYYIERKCNYVKYLYSLFFVSLVSHCFLEIPIVQNNSSYSGQPGIPGAKGERGENGKPGRDGIPGMKGEKGKLSPVGIPDFTIKKTKHEQD